MHFECELLLSYVLPLPCTSPEDSQHKWAVYNFQCYSSCVEKTGFRRKRKASTATRFPPLRLMLQLIMGGPQCQLLGRDGIDIRVCACPGRDRGKEDGPKRKAKAPSPPSPQSLGPHGGKRKGKGKARPATPPPTEPQRVPTTGWCVLCEYVRMFVGNILSCIHNC